MRGLPRFWNNTFRLSPLKQLLVMWGCSEAAFYLFQRHRYEVRCLWSQSIDCCCDATCVTNFCPLALSCSADSGMPCPHYRYTVVNAKLPRKVDFDRVQEIKSRFLQLLQVSSIRELLSGWFHGTPFDHLNRGNVEAFVAYAFYCQQYQELSVQVRRNNSCSCEQ